LRQGDLIAHHTATLPGVAAALHHGRGVAQLMRFKQRSGPFLLLADSRQRAAKLAARMTPELRRQMRSVWPGPVTLLFPALPGLPPCCYRDGCVAVRVDASVQVRQLARASGGLLLSSSLNRRGGTHAIADRKTALRFHRFISARVPGEPSAGRGSRLLRVGRNDSTMIRR